ncbi:branched-chain amino acid ABC transporter permease [Candidatus Bathyarchaeota archaeon]|nr:branched-chain amino acid ABC transporter permease [Candidatus Bathyarchaeota archaeon]
MKTVKVPLRDLEFVTSCVILIVTMLVPVFKNTWVIYVMIFFMLYSIMGHSWNIFSGLTRIISFGHGAFFGLGAYATFIVVRDLSQPFPFSFILSMMLAAAICGATSFLVSYPFLGLRGLSFAICSLAFTEFLAIIFTNTQIIERGREVAFISPQVDLITGYYLVFIILLLVTAAYWKVENSKIGLALKAIGENEDAANSLGVNVFSTIRNAYVISAICMGLAGALFPYIMLSANVEMLFGVNRSLIPLIICIFGGTGSVLGPFLGSIVWQILAEYFRASFGYLHWVILGSCVIAIHLIEPSGLAGMLKKFIKRIS